MAKGGEYKMSDNERYKYMINALSNMEFCATCKRGLLEPYIMVINHNDDKDEPIKVCDQCFNANN